MLLSVLINPILLAIAIGAGLGICHVSGLNPHVHELVMAGVVFIIASQLAVAPVVLQQRRTAMTLTQSSLIGLVLHLLLAIVMGVTIMIITKPPLAFTYWTLIFYWTTLCGLAFVFIRAVRTITPAQPLT